LILREICTSNTNESFGEIMNPVPNVYLMNCSQTDVNIIKCLKEVYEVITSETNPTQNESNWTSLLINELSKNNHPELIEVIRCPYNQ